jgi:transcriptional regulator
MYVPAHFKEDRVLILHETIRQVGFGTLVTYGDDGLEANHLPMLLDADSGPLGMLLGHVARANPQWRRAHGDVQSLAMFLGPNTYITPSWYRTKTETGKVVPTWNYLAIHAYGELAFFDDRSKLRAHVERLTEAHERERTAPWAVSDAPSDYIDQMLGGIVGFTLRIDRLEGKWKMSQNRSAPDRAGVTAGLAEEKGAAQRAVAHVMVGSDDGEIAK